MSAKNLPVRDDAVADGERYVAEQPAAAPFRLGRVGCFLLLAAISLISRFAWLNRPAEVVFDEVHFGKFVSSYCCNADRIFDIHPPHAKLLIAGIGYLGGYRGTFDFDHIGESFNADNVTALRVWPAFAGALLPLVFFGLLLQLGATLPAAMLGGVAVALDNAMTLQSRHILIDSTLLLAIFGAISAYFASRRRAGAAGHAFALLTGALAALAVGTKFTGLSAVSLIALWGFVDLIRLRGAEARKLWLLHAAAMVVGFGGIYLGGWMAHFALLTKPGSGDPFLVPTGHFFTDVIDIHRVMFEVNYGLNFTHPDASPWWSWPFMLKPPLYWSAPEGLMILVGNPAVWWSAALVGLLAFWRTLDMVMSKAARGPRFEGFLIAAAGFLISYVPLARVPRVLFMYHYFTPLLFTVIASCLWLSERQKAVDAKTALVFDRRTLAVAAVLGAGFAVAAPLTFGLVMPHWYLDAALRVFPLR